MSVYNRSDHGYIQTSSSERPCIIINYKETYIYIRHVWDHIVVINDIRVTLIRCLVSHLESLDFKFKGSYFGKDMTFRDVELVLQIVITWPLGSS